MTALIEPQAALEKLGQADARFVDASYGAPGLQEHFAAARIGNAVFFDIDAIADPAAPLPHTIPTPTQFAAHMGRMGISNKDEIIVYDQNGLTFAAARAWWMFRLFGHENVRVLNGGLPAWIRAGNPVETAPPQPHKPSVYVASFNAPLYRDHAAIAADSGDLAMLDARAEPRFAMGHIPGAVNIPFGLLLESDGRMKDPASLQAALAPYMSKNSGKKNVTYCNSGVTACVLALGIHEAGFGNSAVYDGSWSEWSQKYA